MTFLIVSKRNPLACISLLFDRWSPDAYTEGKIGTISFRSKLSPEKLHVPRGTSYTAVTYNRTFVSIVQHRISTVHIYRELYAPLYNNINRIILIYIGSFIAV